VQESSVGRKHGTFKREMYRAGGVAQEVECLPSKL
jgi:hypothetical protein